MTNKKNEKLPAASKLKGFHTSLTARLRRYFLAGILVTAPISITILLTWEFLTFIDYRVGLLLPTEGQDALYGGYGGAAIPGLGLIVAIIFFIVVGWFATNFLGRMVMRVSEYIVHRVPVINTVYKTVKQVFETLIGGKAQAFREVVLIEFPRAGVWTLGFITGAMDNEVQGSTKETLVSVFVPTAPSPVNGFLLFVPKKDIIPLKMSVDEGIKMVVSIGIITPSGTKAAA